MIYPYDTFDDERVEQEANKLEIFKGKRYVEIPISIVVTNQDIEMSLYLGLSPAEYVRRRLSMDYEIIVRRELDCHIGTKPILFSLIRPESE